MSAKNPDLFTGITGILPFGLETISIQTEERCFSSDRHSQNAENGVSRRFPGHQRWHGGGPTRSQLWLCSGRRSTIALSSGGRGGVSSPLTTAPTRWRGSCLSGSRDRRAAPAGTGTRRRPGAEARTLGEFARFRSFHKPAWPARRKRRREGAGRSTCTPPRLRRRKKNCHVADVKTTASAPGKQPCCKKAAGSHLEKVLV